MWIHGTTLLQRVVRIGTAPLSIPLHTPTPLKIPQSALVQLKLAGQPTAGQLAMADIDNARSDVEDPRPAKRVRVGSPQEQASRPLDDAVEHDAQLRRERRARITAFTNPATPGFSGTLKQRCVRLPSQLTAPSMLI